MALYGKISRYRHEPDIARYIHQPPEILQIPYELRNSQQLKIVGRRTLYLSDVADMPGVECTLGADDTAIFNAMQKITAVSGRDTTFSTGDVMRALSAERYGLYENIFTRAVRLLEDFSQAAGAERTGIIERVGREGKSLYGSGSRVRYRMSPGLEISDIRSEEYLELILGVNNPALLNRYG